MGTLHWGGGGGGLAKPGSYIYIYPCGTIRFSNFTNIFCQKVRVHQLVNMSCVAEDVVSSEAFRLVA